MNKKFSILLACLVLVTSGCKKNNLENKNINETTQSKNVEEEINNILFSNLNDEKSLEFVKNVVQNKINKNNFEKYISLVRDYNKDIPKDLLFGDFKNKSYTNYDVGKIIDTRNKINHKFPDTNCRINSFLLLKDEMNFNSDTKIDDELLFMDEESIKNSNLFSDDEFNSFKKLFSRVATNTSKDSKIQGEVMSSYLSNFTFPKKVKMLSLILHDNLDGDYLFIGHVGVLIPIEKGCLFLEKISFEEPYQAVKFANKKSCYKYLKEKYKDYKDPNVAPPFIMENNKYVEI